MDKRRSILNIGTSLVSRIILLLAALVVRRLLIQYIGNEANGLNSLFSSIIGMLSVAELGIGSAIVYAMYKPIVDGNQQQVAGLYFLYKKLYRIIGAVVFVAGLTILPFLPRFISDYSKLHVNVYETFFLTLISVVFTYLYGAKTSLIEAYKNNYITTIILTVGRLIRYGLQVIAIVFFASYTTFIFCQIISTLIVWLLTDRIVRKKHNDIISTQAVADSDTKAGIVRNVKAMLMHKTATVLVMSVDRVIISSFIGVAILGRYSNYDYIATTITQIISLFFTPLTSIIGHLCASGNKYETHMCFYRIYYMNYILGTVFFLGYYAVIDSVVSLLFGSNLELSRPIVFIITLNQFIKYMRRSVLLFRDASGAFYFDRWKAIAEAAANLVLSLLFVKIFPTEYQVVGVIIATIITSLLICNTVEPYVLFRHVLEQPVKTFYIRNYTYIFLFTICLIILSKITGQRLGSTGVVNGILINGLVAIGIALIAMLVIAVFDRSFRNELRLIINRY